MNPILYPATEKAFNTNGIGILSDAILCDVYQETNGQFELEMQYPLTGLHFSDISNERILLAKADPISQLQPFRIYRITKPMDGIVTVYARHIAYDMRGITVAPFSAQNCPAALQALKNNATTECPFEFWTDKDTAAEMPVTVPKSIWTQLGGSKGSILDMYGGEYEFDRFTVKLHNRRGADRGVSIRYGKNLTSLEQDENCANVYTGVHPYWLGSDGTLIQLTEKILHAEGNYIKERILPLDLSKDFETQPTEDELRARAQKYMKDNDIGVPAVSWKVEFIQLEQTEEYKGKALLERVLIGDTVSVEFAEMGVSASARAVAGRYDSLRELFKSITLGKVRSNITDTIVQQQQQIQQVPTMTDLERAQKAATDWLTNGKGYKVERRDATGNVVDTLYMDTPDMNTAVNVLRIGQSGIGFSYSGVNGPYISAWTIDGRFNTDFIRTGVITSADGTIKVDLSNNTITIATLVNGFAGKMKLSSDGISGYSGDEESEIFKLWITGDGATLSSGSGGTRITISGSGKTTLGRTSCESTLIGATVDINGLNGLTLQGKSVSWEDNGNGTCTLIGS